MAKKWVQKKTLGVDNSLPSFESNASTSQTKKSKDKEKLNLPFSFNTFFQPGIYAIINRRLNKYYIGQAANLADRLSHHISQLSVHKHDCSLLQEDWKRYEPIDFDFIILEIGSEWFDKIRRLQAERNYIQLYRKQCYNRICLNIVNKTIPQVNRQNSIPIIGMGQYFESISEACRYFGFSQSTIRSRLNSPKYDNWFYANPQKRVSTHLARAVVVCNDYYMSVSTAAAALGISEKTIRKIKLVNQTGYSQGRSVQVKDQIFTSIRQTSLAFEIDSHTVRKRIESLNFPDWKWFNASDS